MPSFFKKPCKYPNCRCYATQGSPYCEKHKAEQDKRNAQRLADFDKQRGNSNDRGYNRTWRRIRIAFLKEHPLCVKCGRPATDVDHIKAHKGDKDLFWDENNWQPLCHACHSRKTATEDSNFCKRTPRGS